MAITVTITLSDNDPRARAILDLIAPPPAAPANSALTDRVASVLANAPQLMSVSDIAAMVAIDGGSSVSRQTIANALQKLKARGLVANEGRSWRVVR